MLVKTEGIVLKSINYGEGSKIITLYTRKMGKVSLMVKGARKIKSRFHALTQLFAYGQYIFYLGKGMGTLNQGDLELPFSDIIKDLEKTAYATYIVELMDKLVEPNEANPFLFQQLLSSLEQINAGKDQNIVMNIFEIKMLITAGYRPQLQACAICGNHESLTAFSLKHGGLICHLHNEESKINLQHATVKLLKLFEHVDIARLGKVEVKSEIKLELERVLRSFFDEYVSVHIKSRHFLDQLKNFNWE